MDRLLSVNRPAYGRIRATTELGSKKDGPAISQTRPQGCSIERWWVKTRLETHGYAPCSVGSPPSTFTAIYIYLSTLTVLDIELGNAPGIRILGAIHTAGQKTLTSQRHSVLANRFSTAQDSDSDGWHGKPFSLQSVVNAVNPRVRSVCPQIPSGSGDPPRREDPRASEILANRRTYGRVRRCAAENAVSSWVMRTQ